MKEEWEMKFIVQPKILKFLRSWKTPKITEGETLTMSGDAHTFRDVGTGDFFSEGFYFITK